MKIINSQLYRKNIDSLKDENHDIKEYLLQDIDRGIEKELVADTEEIAGKNVLYAARGDQQLQLDFLYDSTELLDKWVRLLKNQNFRSRYILFGLGNGMYVQKLLQNIEEESVIIVYEPSSIILKKVMEDFDISNILSNKQVFLFLENISKVKFLDLLRKHMKYDDIAGTVCRAYLNYSTLFAESNESFNKDISFHCTCLDAAHTVLESMGFQYYVNSVYNYIDMVKGKSLVALRRNLQLNIPAFIISSGPSLDKNILEIKKAKNRGFIVAADSAVGAMLKNDILPDMVMTIDAFKLPQHFGNERISEVPLVCSLSCNRELLKLHKGDRYFINDENTYVEKFYSDINKIFPVLSSGGSVATSIFNLLEVLGFKTIVLVGQDLAYPDEKMYSNDTVRGEQKVDYEILNTLWVEGIDGEPVISSYEFEIYRNWFEEKIEINKDLRVIDATEGGALIHGSIVQTLSETIEEECKKDVNIDAIMKQIPDRFNMEEKRQYIDYMHNLPNHLRDMEGEIAKQISHIHNMEKLVAKNQINSKKMSNMLKKAGKMGDKIEKMGGFYYLMNYSRYLFNEKLNGDMYKIQGNEKDELVETINKLSIYYSIMEENLPPVISGIEYVNESYLEEKKEIFESIMTS